jgi:hypothetical protein
MSIKKPHNLLFFKYLILIILLTNNSFTKATVKKTNHKLNFELATGLGLRYGEYPVFNTILVSPLLKVSKNFKHYNIFLETTALAVTNIATMGSSYRATNKDSFHIATFIGKKSPEYKSKLVPFYGFKIGYTYNLNHLDKSGWETSIDIFAIKKNGTFKTNPEYDTVPTVSLGYHWKFTNFEAQYIANPSSNFEDHFNLEIAYGVGLRYGILPHVLAPIPLININRRLGKSTFFSEAVVGILSISGTVGYAYNFMPNLNLTVAAVKGDGIITGTFSGAKTGVIYYFNGLDKKGFEISFELYLINSQNNYYKNNYEKEMIIIPSISFAYHWKNIKF